jgi:hypothetical protein
MKSVLSNLFTNIGSCSICIQTAFRAALASGGALGIMAVLGWTNLVSLPSSLTYLALILFLSFTALWILHVIVFGIRSANFSIRKALGIVGQKDEGHAEIVSRRNYLKIATQSALGIAVFTVANSMLISSASANQYCGNRGRVCPNGQCCIWGDGTTACCATRCSYQEGMCGP